MRSCCDIIISCIFSRRLVSQLQFYKSKQGAHFSNKPDLNRAVMKCSAATGRDRRSEIKKEKKKKKNKEMETSQQMGGKKGGRETVNAPLPVLGGGEDLRKQL